jgi:asparagine N-glycosylation enzyme membrane subunit Stt3
MIFQQLKGVKVKIDKRKEILIIAVILIIAFIIRFLTYSSNDFAGYDPYVHYSVVEQAIENNELPIRNHLDGCPNGVKINHPIGFYILPMILGYLINLKVAFALTSVLAGVASLFLVYLIFKKVFNIKIALIGILFLAVCFAHISRSHASFYRGENIMLPFLLLSLYFGLKFLTEKKKWLFASLAALFSALTVFIWPGYAYALIVYIASVTLFVFYEFLKKKKLNVYPAMASIALQYVLVRIFALLSNAPEHVFSAKYLILIAAASLAFLFFMKIFAKKSIKQKLIFIAAVAALCLIVLLVGKGLFAQLLSGFELIKPTNAFYKNLQELQPITLGIIIYFFWIIPVFSAAGFIFMLYKLDNKKMFLLGAVIPSIYLLTTTIRFTFLSSVMIIPLIGVLIGFKKAKKAIYIAAGILFVLTAVHGISSTVAIPSPAHEDMVAAYDYFSENTNKSSCIVAIPDWGGMTQYYAKRPSFISSTNQNIDQFLKLNEFFFTNKSLGIEIENSYIGLMPDDFKKIEGLIEIVGIEGLFAEKLILIGKKENENEYISSSSRKYTAKSTTDITVTRDGKSIQTVFLETDTQIFRIINNDAEDDGCVYLSNYVSIYFNNKLCSTNMVKMLTMQEIPGLELWHATNNVRIYKIK